MKKNRISTYLFILIFFVLVVLVGAISAKNLVKYYINDEVGNNELSAGVSDVVEADISTTFFQRFWFVNINGAIRNLLGQQEMNKVIKLNNGYLLTAIRYVEDEVLQNHADNVKKLNEYLKNKNIGLLYAITPYTSGKYDPQLPVGVSDYGNDDGDRLVSKIKEAGVDVIDFRDKMHEDGIDHYKMMYKTDHHWTTEAGFYAYTVLEDYIREKTGCEIDERISEPSSYTVTKYKNGHLGSRGHRTGQFFAGKDDFDLYLPNFETNIEDPDGNVGGLADVVLDLTPLEKLDSFPVTTYDGVLSKSLGHYKNLYCPNDTKVLIITDSFAKAVNPFLIMGFSEVEYVYDKNASMITPEFIESYDPDVVILLYYLDNALGDDVYCFQGFD